MSRISVTRPFIGGLLFASLLCVCSLSGCSDSPAKKVVGKWRLTGEGVPAGALVFECRADGGMTLTATEAPTVSGNWKILPDNQLQFYLVLPGASPMTAKQRMNFSDRNHLELSGDSDDSFKGTFARISEAKPSGEKAAPVLGSWQTGGTGSFGLESVTFIYQFKKDGTLQRNVSHKGLDGEQTAQQQGTWDMEGDVLNVRIGNGKDNMKLAGSTAGSMTWLLSDGTSQTWTRVGDAR